MGQPGVFLELVLWEDFLDTLSATRLQDEYNRAIRACDVFVMLFFTKVGPYTEEEFETAVGQFQATSRPFIFTYFKNAPNSAPRADLLSLRAFQDKLKALGHFQTEYHNAAELLLHFSQQLDKLVASGFIEFKPDQTPQAVSTGTSQQATLTGDGAIAQGTGATAVGAGGVFVGGKNTGNIHTGTRIGGDLVHGDKILGNKVGTQINTGGGAHVGGNVYADAAPLLHPIERSHHDARRRSATARTSATRVTSDAQRRQRPGHRRAGGRAGRCACRWRRHSPDQQPNVSDDHPAGGASRCQRGGAAQRLSRLARHARQRAAAARRRAASRCNCRRSIPRC